MRMSAQYRCSAASPGWSGWSLTWLVADPPAYPRGRGLGLAGEEGAHDVGEVGVVGAQVGPLLCVCHVVPVVHQRRDDLRDR